MTTSTAAAEEFADRFLEELRASLADAFDLPPELLGLHPRPAPTLTRWQQTRRRVAAHVGQTGWRIGYTVAQAGRHLDRVGDRIIDAGDWLAGKVSGR